MKSLRGLVAVFAFATAASGQELTWQDLVRRPELRPTQCSMRQGLEFQSGMKVVAGQKVNILELEAGEIVLSTPDGRIVFAAQPDDTDVLAVANAEYAKLTPAQRELTHASLLQRPELWPWKLTVLETFDLGAGRRINKGDSVYLMAAVNGELVVTPSQFDMHFELPPEDTDILAQARQYVDSKDGAPGRLVQELDGKLIDAATGQPAPFQAGAVPRYYVVYHAARWCPYTQKFTPSLLELYEQMKPQHPEFEVIYVPAEKSAAELQQYAKEVGFPWPAVAFHKKRESAVLGWTLGRSSLPELGVYDRYGNMVIDPSQVDRDTALQQLAALWKQPSAGEK